MDGFIDPICTDFIDHSDKRSFTITLLRMGGRSHFQYCLSQFLQLAVIPIQKEDQ